MASLPYTFLLRLIFLSISRWVNLLLKFSKCAPEWRSWWVLWKVGHFLQWAILRRPWGKNRRWSCFVCFICFLFSLCFLFPGTQIWFPRLLLFPVMCGWPFLVTFRPPLVPEGERKKQNQGSNLQTQVHDLVLAVLELRTKQLFVSYSPTKSTTSLP